MKTSKCRSCGAEIVWLKTKTGKSIPVDRESILDENATVFDSGKNMISHFATCPDAGTWRKHRETSHD